MISPLRETAEALARLPTSELIATSQARLEAGTASNEVLWALHLAANAARAGGEAEDAQRLFTQVLQHNGRDHNVRIALAEYRFRAGDFARVQALLLPVHDVLTSEPGYEAALEMLLDARLRSGDGDGAEMGGAGLQGPRAHARLAVLDRLGLLDAGAIPAGRWNALLRYALAAASEYELLGALREAATLLSPADGEAWLKPLIAVIGICEAQRWPRPYHQALQLLERLAGDMPPAELPALWSEAGLRPVALTPLLDLAALGRRGGDASARLEVARTAFLAAPSAARAAEVWDLVYRDGRFDLAARLTPAATLADPEAERLADPAFGRGQALAARWAPASLLAPLARLWYLITWHEGAERLLRLLALLSAPHTTVVVSVGGSQVPEELARLSTALLASNIHVLFRPAVTWGGQKLLFHNVYEVMQALLAGDGDWLHVICNRSFPLMGPRETGRLLAEPGFLDRHPGIPAQPVWSGEWGQETADRINEIYHAAMDDVFETAEVDAFRRIADADHKLAASVFNFSDRPEVLEARFKDGSHSYNVSPFGTDMRWMSFARLGEFVDVSTETGATFSRRMHPLVARWVQRVINASQLRTGDPFVLMSRRYAETALHDPRAVELFAAMNLGFAPEMNFFDTLAMTESFGLQREMAHTYFRNDRQEAGSEDVLAASRAAEIERNLFMRKTWPGLSDGFVAEFSEKVGAEWPADESYVAARFGELTPTGNLIPDVRELLEAALPALSVSLRTLVGNPLGEARCAPDGALYLNEMAQGRWSWQDRALRLDFDDPAWGTKVYRRVASDGRRLTLAPAELVSMRNGWGVFLDIPLDALAAASERSPAIAMDLCSGLPPSHGPWRLGRSATAVLLDAFVETDHPDYRIPVERTPGRILEVRQAGRNVLALCEVDGWPALLRVEEVVVLHGGVTLLLRRALGSDPQAWEAATGGALTLIADRASLAGHYRLSTLGGASMVDLAVDGTLRNAEGALMGRWFAAPGAFWVLGYPKLRVAKATQLQRQRDGRWRLSGWAWANMEDRVTFSLTPS